MACLAVATLFHVRVVKTFAVRTQLAAAAGLLLAVACLLRPEAVWYSLVLAVLWRPRATVPWLLGGFVLPMAAYAFGNLVEAGTPLGFHASANLSTMGDRWLAVRAERLGLWLSLGDAVVWLGVGLVAGGWMSVRLGLDLRAAQAVALLGALVVALAGALKRFPSDSLWHAWPVGLIALIPQSDSHGQRDLRTLLIASSLGVWLTSTHDGGAQWGPRFLLIAAPCFGALAGLAASSLSSDGRFRLLRRSIVAAIIVAGAWTSRTAYLELRSAKRHSAELVTAIAAAAPVDSFVLTNVWWLDQIAAPLHGTRHFLFVESSDAASLAVAALSQARIGRVLFAVVDEPSSGNIFDIAMSGSCFAVHASTRAAARKILLRHATCAE